ncbi:hypothetical protein MPC1_4720001 [Methylocella tundrae]|nr:hypothetical protein MPC1_4720001 [Methylocella tundrae]
MVRPCSRPNRKRCLCGAPKTRSTPYCSEPTQRLHVGETVLVTADLRCGQRGVTCAINGMCSSLAWSQ